MNNIKIPSDITVIAIQNYGSSGTLFLQSLLDNHPNILMTPALYSQSLFHFWENHPHDNMLDNLVKSFMDHYSYWFSPDGAVKGWGLHQMGVNMNETVSISSVVFSETLKDIINFTAKYPTRKLFFIAVYVAYAHALDRKFNDNSVIVFPIHSLPQKYAKYLVEDFPDVKFLYMIREPIQCIKSGIKHILSYKVPVNVIECVLAQMLNDYTKIWGRKFTHYVKGDRPYFKEYAGRSKAVRLEDLHKMPKEILGRICHWLNIPWNDCLLESTFNGKKWWNRPESPRISGFDLKTINNQKHYNNLFWEFDNMRLYCLLYPKYKIWNYQLPSYAKNILLRYLLFFLLLCPFKTEFSLFKHRLSLVPKAICYRFIDTVLYTKLKEYDVFIRIKNKSKEFMALYKTKNKYLFVPLALMLLPILPVLVLRDYFMIRWWLYRCWFTNIIYIKRPEVRLLYEVENKSCKNETGI